MKRAFTPGVAIPIVDVNDALEYKIEESSIVAFHDTVFAGNV